MPGGGDVMAWLKVFDLVPSWVYALAVTLCVAFCGVQEVLLSHEQAAHAKADRDYQAEQARAAQATQRAEAAERAEETRRQEKKDEIAESARMEARRVTVARAAADVAGRSLRDAAAALAARARETCASPVVGDGKQAAPGPADLLADVLGSLEEQGRGVAEEADRRRIAGLSCEREYDSLRPPP